MKEKIRKKVFETNSSSMHSLTLCSDSDYEKWKKGELIYDWRGENLITQEEKEQRVKKEIESLSNLLSGKDKENAFYKMCKLSSSKEAGGDMHVYYTYEDFQNGVDIYDTTFEETFTTEKGEIVHAFGYHGRT